MEAVVPSNSGSERSTLKSTLATRPAVDQFDLGDLADLNTGGSDELPARRPLALLKMAE